MKTPYSLLLLFITNTAVENVFMEFGEAHAVFAGRFKDELNDICNGKRRVRLTPFKSKQDLMELDLWKITLFSRNVGKEKKSFAKNV